MSTKDTADQLLFISITWVLFRTPRHGHVGKPKFEVGTLLKCLWLSEIIN